MTLSRKAFRLKFLRSSIVFIIPILLYQPIVAQNTRNVGVATSQAAADSLVGIGKNADAKKIYQALLKSDAKNENNVLRLMACNMALRQYDEAYKNITYYLSLNTAPNPGVSVQLYSSLAKIWSVRNDEAKGFEFLTKAVDSGYSRIDEFDTESDFNALRGNKNFIVLRERAEINAYPCLSNPKVREFDFMIGEWDVYNNPSTGFVTLVGYNKWERISGGCAILENWTAVGAPHNGKSLNYFDPRKKSWEQVWVGSEGVGPIVQRFLNGAYDSEQKVMEFEYEFETAQGVKQNHRFRFFNIDENNARQLKETSIDGGKTWAVNYDFIYKRKK